MYISIIIPIHNEEKTLEKSISGIYDIFNNTEKELILVNDGSTDKTSIILDKFKHQNIKIYNHATNLGKGMAIQTGLQNCTGEYVGIYDADLEYKPEELYRLFEIAEKEKTVVYGKRSGQDGYLLNRLGNKILSMTCNILFSSQLHDIYTCYKIIPRNIFENLKITSDGFEIEAEITAKLLKNKIPIKEVPISYSPRSFKDGKHIRWIDGIKGILKLLEIKFFN
jgi:glycosyltransferase involved in cell wall biosynthesis